MSSVIASATNVYKSYEHGAGAAPVLADCTCEVRTGELTLLMGPSGSGKTTLISILGGLLRTSSGVVTLCGHTISNYDERAVTALRREHLGFVFQSYKLFPALSALDNVAEALVLKGRKRKLAREQAAHVLERVGLGARLLNRPDQLSGGQKQRVAIARALAAEPALLIGDEVTAALDTESAHAVMELLSAQLTPRSAVVLVTHDARLEKWAHRVLRMVDGNTRAQVPGGAARLLERAPVLTLVEGT